MMQTLGLFSAPPPLAVLAWGLGARRLEEREIVDCINYLIDRRSGFIEATIAHTHNDSMEVPAGNVKM